MMDQTPNKIAEVFGELVYYLYDRSLSLIIRDARNDGRKAKKFKGNTTCHVVSKES